MVPIDRSAIFCCPKQTFQATYVQMCERVTGFLCERAKKQSKQSQQQGGVECRNSIENQGS